MDNSRIITLHHLYINNKKQIGLKFFPNKIIQTIIKGLPNPRWSNLHNMAFIINTPKNLDTVYKNFKGVAWVNGNYFFDKKLNLQTVNPTSINEFRLRVTPEGYNRCPECFLQKLE